MALKRPHLTRVRIYTAFEEVVRDDPFWACRSDQGELVAAVVALSLRCAPKERAPAPAVAGGDENPLICNAQTIVSLQAAAGCECVGDRTRQDRSISLWGCRSLQTAEADVPSRLVAAHPVRYSDSQILPRHVIVNLRLRCLNSFLHH